MPQMWHYLKSCHFLDESRLHFTYLYFLFYIENLLDFKEDHVYYKIYNVYLASCSKCMWDFVSGCLLLRREMGHLVKVDRHVWVARGRVP